MATTQVVAASVYFTTNNSFQNYTHPDDHTQQSKYCMVLIILDIELTRLQLSIPDCTAPAISLPNCAVREALD